MAIYGADQSGVAVLNACHKSRIRIVALYDRDPAKVGKVIAGVPVKFPEEIGTDVPNALLICSKGHENEIYRDMQYLEKEGVVLIRAAHEGLI